MMIDKESAERAINVLKNAAWLGAVNSFEETEEAVKTAVMALQMVSAQPEPAIPISWIEGQIEWLKSLDNAFSTLTAGQISAMVNKWKDEQDE